MLALWAEQDVILADEFRDGNVSAGSGKPARDIEQQRRQVRHEMVTPLSTGSTWPVTMRDSSLAR